MDPEVMKTSTVFAGETPKTTKDLHLLIYSFLEFDEKFKGIYGLQKAFSSVLNKYVAIGAFVRRGKYRGVDIVEGAIFLKSEYIGSGIGFWIEKKALENFEDQNIILIASAWSENKVAIKLMQKNGMVFSRNFIKERDKKKITVNFYARFPKHIPAIYDEFNIQELLACNKL